MKYTVVISYTNPLTQLLDIKLVIEGLEKFDLQLASWRPGRYELQNYAQYVYPLSINRGEVIKITKDKWQVNADGRAEISYQFQAARMDAGSTWLDEEQLYLNFINFIPAVVGYEDKPIQVEFETPESYRFASALPVEENKLIASSYHELVDTPVIASASLKEYKYEVMGTTFFIWIQGKWEPNKEQMINDFTAFTQKQLDLFDGFPNSEYHFLIQALPYKYYHGVEHKNSTVITLGPHEELSEWKWYKELLGVSSHELFHCWNVTRIRPKEMTPYDFSKEAYHKTGYVTEGLTTYYGDLFLRASGVFNDEQYLDEMNNVLKRHFQNEGRLGMSVAESSFDLWLDGYKLGAPNRKVSIYNEGAICALLLDLKIISSSNGLESLSSVMLDLWHEHGKPGRGYTEHDYKDIVGRYISDASDYFSNYIDGTKDVFSDLEIELEKVGCLLVEQQDKDELVQFGLRTLPKAEGAKEIVRIAKGSDAEQQLMIGEVINSSEETEGKLTMKVSRKGVEREVSIMKDRNHFNYYQIMMVETPSDDQQRLRNKWLGVL